jgi:hypothetical protein
LGKYKQDLGNLEKEIKDKYSDVGVLSSSTGILHIIFSMYCQYAVLCSFCMFAFICLSLESLHLPLCLYFLYFFLYFDIFVFISLVIYGRFFRKTKANILNEQFQKAFTPATDDPIPSKGQSQHPQMPDIIITENGINKLLQNINYYCILDVS